MKEGEWIKEKEDVQEMPEEENEDEKWKVRK